VVIDGADKLREGAKVKLITKESKASNELTIPAAGKGNHQGKNRIKDHSQ